MSTDLNFEFEAPQFIESLDKANDVDDGADNFFDALESLEHDAGGHQNNKSEEKFSRRSFLDEEEAFSNLIGVNKIAQEDRDIENVGSIVSNNEGYKLRRLSLKRKASPLKDRNVNVPPTSEKSHHRKLAKRTVISCLPTIAESPVLRTKLRVRPKPPPEDYSQKRSILKPVRKRNIGICIKPQPKPPTIPEPFNLTETGKHVHHCYEDPVEKEATCIRSITPGRKYIRKKDARMSTVCDALDLEITNKSGAFSFYGRDLEIMKRKRERMSSKNQENECKFEFKAKSPSVLKKEPFRPEVPGRVLRSAGPELSTESRAKRKENNGCFMTFGEKKMQELEKNLFVFKGHSVPKATSSTISTSSSSKKNFFNSSMVSSICTKGSNKSMAFSFYERDKEMLKRKEERLKQVEQPKFEFKAKAPAVLQMEPFWPIVESRVIPEPSSPNLSTKDRAEKRKQFNHQGAIRQRKIEEELRKYEEEDIRKYRKTLEFKATSVKK